MMKVEGVLQMSFEVSLAECSAIFVVKCLLPSLRACVTIRGRIQDVFLRSVTLQRSRGVCGAERVNGRPRGVESGRSRGSIITDI